MAETEDDAGPTMTLDSADEENPKSSISEDEEEINLAVDDMDGASAVVHQAHWRLH